MKASGMVVMMIAGCGGGRGSVGEPVRPVVADGEALAIDAMPALPPLPSTASIGAFVTARVTGPTYVVADMAATDDAVLMLLGDLGPVQTKLGRLDDGGEWQLAPITAPAVGAQGVLDEVVNGHGIAVRDGEVAITLAHDRFDGKPDALEVRWPDPAVEGEMLEGCGGPRSGLAITAEGPVIADTCDDRLHLIARRDGVWHRQAIADRGAWVIDVAIDHLGAVHVMTSWSYLVVDGDQVRDGVLPERFRQTEGIGGCGGRVWGAFALEGDPDRPMWAGPWNGTAWELEPVPVDFVSTSAFGFDEACRPFLAVHAHVFARTAQGWSGGTVGDGVDALAVRDGVLHAAYDTSTTPVEVGVATAAITVDP